MIRALIAALALAASACTPVTEAAEPASTPQTAEADCTARGGTMQRVGRMQTLQCVVRYADAGNRCTDGDDCQGDCRIEGNKAEPNEGEAAVGQCAASSNRFGCYTQVEDGKSQGTICVD